MLLLIRYGIFRNVAAAFWIPHFRAQREVAAIGPMAEPQQRRNAFAAFPTKERLQNY
jgi:hypothetical protein